MNREYPNPWDFSNTDQNLRSPNGEYRLEFGELNEIAMGAPIGGPCYLIFEDKKIKINDWAGGPVIWNNTSDKVALPIWTKNRNQKISIVNIANMTITLFKKEFRVLHLDKFDGELIFGVDSPIYMTTELSFDIDREEIEIVKSLGKS